MNNYVIYMTQKVLCDHCGAEMTFTGNCMTSLPPLYEHQCPKCKTYKLSRYMNIEEECIDPNVCFSLDKKESKEYKDFCKKHKECEFTSTTGGKISITFTPTGFGNIVSVKCSGCGEIKDITNTDAW